MPGDQSNGGHVFVDIQHRSADDKLHFDQQDDKPVQHLGNCGICVFISLT